MLREVHESEFAKISPARDRAEHSNLENPGWIECIIPISILFNPWQFPGN